MVFLVLLFIALTNAYSVDLLNEFSGDVDIYDMGTMGRGKNAASWHYSLKTKQNVFYYLAMQPWRHLEWTDCTGSTCYKYIINEDASNLPKEDGSTELKIESANDYCRKEYAHPMATFDIDWEQIDPEARLDSLDINGIVCYRHPAKAPLANIYLQQQYNKKEEVGAMTPCRYDFIGGKSITFRSFNDLSKVFFTSQGSDGYLINKTRCSVPVTPNNVNTDLAIVLGISDPTVKQNLYTAVTKLKEVANLKEATLYYLSGESIKKETIKEWKEFYLKQISVGAVDAVINAAKNDLAKRVKDKKIDRGTMIVLMDRALQTAFDAETAFDRNNITVHTVIFNPRNEHLIVKRATSLLSVGYHQHEFKDNAGISKVIDDLFIGIRANLTERCNRTSCNGFCDGRDRCTCPMCCENTCFFSYCNVTTATCMPWPEANPKKKIVCDQNQCVGEQECFDLIGCVYTSYNPGCKPAAKCMKPICEKNVCKIVDGCQRDLKPSKDNKCWSYKCEEKTGNCVRHESGDPCPATSDMCAEFVCDDNLVCRKEKKECVKTSPYAEMECYKAQCNPNTGKCEHVLDCPNTELDSLRGCGKTSSASLCKCGKDFKCTCTDPSDKSGFCEEDEICDTTTGVQQCRKSKCGQDLYVYGCQIKTCDETTGLIEWKDKDCSKLVDIVAGGSEVDIAKKYCLDKYEIYCDNGNCGARGKSEDAEFYYAACGVCSISAPVKSNGKDVYTVTYTEQFNDVYKLTCPDGTTSSKYDKYFKKNGEDIKPVCTEIEGEWMFVYKTLTKEEAQDYCAGCFEEDECNRASEYRQYTYDPITGTCSYRQVKVPPQCYECNTEGTTYVPNCIDQKFEQTFTFERGDRTKDFKYNIDKLCINDQCIPNPEFQCQEAVTANGDKIVDILKTCGEVSYEYHYSTLFSKELSQKGMAQSQAFLDEAEKEAYCTYVVTEEECKRCGILDNSNLEEIDVCEEQKTSYGDKAQYIKETKCVNNKCEYKFDRDCPSENCIKKYYNPVENKCLELENTCTPVKDEIEAITAKYQKKHPNEKEIKCYAAPKCGDDEETCDIDKNSKACSDAYERYLAGTEDFGCRIPNVDCDFETFHCTYTEITKPEEDTRYFLNRDNVVFGDLCYNYTCVEETVDGKLEHHWRLTAKSLEEQNKQPESVCEVASCNPLTGRSESKVKDCLVSEHFKQISEAQAECFYCQCSYLNGEMVLVMMPETEGKTYELDACGNCIVRDKRTGQQINDPVDCVLDAPVNLTGAIAGATVAASVVFGLIGSMVVVSIGAFQTYQLVSSAMKNVISTTLENPEFVAADNEATNVLNNE